MLSHQLILNVNIPDLDEFKQRFPQYGSFARGDGSILFNHIMTPHSFIRAMVASELGLPAVAGVAKSCIQIIKQNSTLLLSGHVKQFIGAITCSLMEANGFRKTGTKRSIPHPGFTKGEFYILITEQDRSL